MSQNAKAGKQSRRPHAAFYAVSAHGVEPLRPQLARGGQGYGEPPRVERGAGKRPSLKIADKTLAPYRHSVGRSKTASRGVVLRRGPSGLFTPRVERRTRRYPATGLACGVGRANGHRWRRSRPTPAALTSDNAPRPFGGHFEPKAGKRPPRCRTPYAPTLTIGADSFTCV